MATYVDRAGAFQGVVTEYGIKEHKKAGSVTYSLNIRAKLTAIYNRETEGWDDWQAGDVTVDGYINIVKKDGTWNESQVTSIMEFAGWDGTFASLQEQKWQPLPCQFDVKLDDYNNQFQIDWFAAFDRVPGGLGNCDAAKAKELDAKLGSSLRAITGNIKRAASQPQDPPPDVAPPGAIAPTPGPQEQHGPPKPDDDIPF